MLLCACASTGQTSEEAATLPEGDPVAAAMGRSEYLIGPSDLLAVTVFQIEDLDREVRVNNAGQIALPLVGAVAVAGRTVGEIEQEIAGLYRERYLQDPQVSVFVKEFSSQRVTVGGAVKKPGIFPMTSSLSLLQSLALAEGFSDVASHRNVLVFRTIDGERKYARFDVDAIEKGEHPDPQVYGEDVIVVDTSLGRQTLRTLIQLAPFIAVWRSYN
ncbi:MAG TPA: polysaccharide biosynthesis/export family protein [Lysobacter sp.]